MAARLFTPRSLRALASPASTLSRPCISLCSRPYHSFDFPPPPSPYTPVETEILTSALANVPTYGFTPAALASGAREAGYLDITTNLFPGGAFDLVKFHLWRERERLKLYKEEIDAAEGGAGKKVRELVVRRLKANEKVIGKWHEALAIMAMPTNIPASVKEMALLMDEIWYLAGDKSADMNWYTKRMSLGTVFGATEIYMTQDKSPNFEDTWGFLDRRLKDAHELGSLASGIGSYASFTAHATMNILRSKSILK